MTHALISPFHRLIFLVLLQALPLPTWMTSTLTWNSSRVMWNVEDTDELKQSESVYYVQHQSASTSKTDVSDSSLLEAILRVQVSC